VACCFSFNYCRAILLRCLFISYENCLQVKGSASRAEKLKMSSAENTSCFSKLRKSFRIKRGLKLFKDFCDDTSIHGVKFLGAKKKHWTER
jgi:hypothetical protein